MTLVEAMFHILQQGFRKGTLIFETPDQVIKNISRDIDVVAKKAQKQKRQELEVKIRRTKVNVITAKKELVKKKNIAVENSLNSNNEISFPPQKKKFILC